MKFPKIAIAALSLSAAGFAGLVGYEGWSETAIIPVKGDVPTVGPGLTKRPDGSPVQMGDKITPVEGIKRSLAHIQEGEKWLRRCVKSPLSQVEYDLLVDFSYQYGVRATCISSMVKHINAREYVKACEAYKMYRFVAGYDCSTPGNKRCAGVWTRSLERYNKCMDANG